MKATLHPEITSQFYTLIGEAQYTLNQSLPAEIENYLVLLLIRFMDHQNFLHQSIGQAYLEAHLEAHASPECFKTLGDTCLITTGLFPEYKSRRGLSTQYYIDIGQQSFLRYAEYTPHSSSDLFMHLSSDFKQCTDILQATRHDAWQHTDPLSSNFLRPC